MVRFSKWLLRIFGWKVVGTFQEQKSVIVVFHHSSNWDFPLGLLLRKSMRLDTVHFAGKDALFKPPFGWIFRALGGYPVNRSNRSNFVDAVVDIFNEKDAFNLAVAPEGTRKKVTKLRTGFYYIALGAKVPIVMCAFDWGKKELVWSEPFMPSGQWEKDYAQLKSFFQDKHGYYPHLDYEFR